MNQKPIGTGPFEFVAYQQDAAIRYEANPDYWGGQQAIDNLVFAITTDAAVRVQKLKAGECQVMPYPAPADVEMLRADPDITVLEQQGLNVGYLAYNTSVAPFDNPRVRKALRPAISRRVFNSSGMARRGTGAGHLRLMFVTILPNCLAPLIVQGTLSFSSAILDAAALGFLGMGAQPPTPEWGTMLAEAREFIFRAWWVVTFPGLMILITVLAINLVGDGLRDALDPKLKRSW